MKEGVSGLPPTPYPFHSRRDAAGLVSKKVVKNRRATTAPPLLTIAFHLPFARLLPPVHALRKAHCTSYVYPLPHSS